VILIIDEVVDKPTGAAVLTISANRNNAASKEEVNCSTETWAKEHGLVSRHLSSFGNYQLHHNKGLIYLSFYGDEHRVQSLVESYKIELALINDRANKTMELHKKWSA
jgi:hypothetical protein